MMTNEKQIDTVLKRIYYKPNHNASFSNIERLWIASNKKISKKAISEWLLKQMTYTLHKPKRKKYKRNEYDVNNIGDLWQADLIDVQNIAKLNNDYKYILAVIDVFSKYGWCEPLKQKSSKEIIRGFTNIFKNKTDRIPLQLQTDKGREFTNKQFQNFLTKNKVHYFTTNNCETKACIAERYIRTIKTVIYKYFTYTNNCKYINILDDVVLAYNNKKHRSIGMAPKQVSDKNILSVWQNLTKNRIKNSKKPKYIVGDYVRISKIKRYFTKGYKQNWTEEVFKIVSVILRNPVVYKLSDLADEIVTGVFYELEIQKVIIDENTEYLIDKILRVKRNGNSRSYLVKWKGYPEKFNSWVKEALITKK